MFSTGQLAAVHAAFALAGYEGELRTLPVDCEDEQIFVLDQAVVMEMDVRSLKQLPGRKVWVLASIGDPTVPFE